MDVIFHANVTIHIGDGVRSVLLFAFLIAVIYVFVVKKVRCE